MLANGPLDQFVRTTGMDHNLIDARLRKGDVATTIVFAADILHGVITHLDEMVERLVERLPDQESASPSAK